MTRRKTHGMTKTPEHDTWIGMRQRCENPNFPKYEYYGGRGIKVCDRWRDFANFYADMGPRPHGLTLERIDNDGDYTPDNCRWATRKDQMRNQRITRRVTIDGKTYVAADLADQSGLKTDTIVERAKRGLSLADVIAPEKMVFHEGLALGGVANGARLRALTHCKNGHEFSAENTHTNDRGFRICRACKRERERQRRQRLGI